jgi:hypothetical protein
MFDLDAAKISLNAGGEKSEISPLPCAIPAIPEPKMPSNSTNSMPLPSEIEKVNQWLDHIGEYELDARLEVLDKLHTPDGLAYFTARAYVGSHH